jgi:nucleotide-binding universal stress UspA family protein
MKTMPSPPETPSLNSRPLLLANQANRFKANLLLVPIDFSAGSFKALEYALALKKEFGAQLHLVHVCDYDRVPSAIEVATLTLSRGELRRHWTGELRKFAAELGAHPEPKNLHVATGRAYHEICQLAGKLGADLIVTATRGHTGLKHVLLGSTAERVVQHSPCAVLVVRPREHDFLRTNAQHETFFQLNRILVPLDFSECSMAGLEFAIPFAHFWKAHLTLFNAVPITPATPYGGFGVRDVLGEIDWQGPAKNALHEIASATLERGVVVNDVVEVGPAARQICDYAGRSGSDLIVLSTHGSTGFLHAVLGSTAEHVVRYARCPVLVVPTRETNGDKL